MTGRILLIAACLAGTAVAQEGRKSFSLEPDGSWQRVAAPPSKATQGDQPVDDPALDRIAARVQRGDYDDGFRDVVAWLKRNPRSPSYDRGLLVAAAALKGKKDPVRAFYYCDQLLDEFPESSRYQDALEMQYELAELYFDGLKDKVLGLRVLGRSDAAIEMLFRIQQRAPGSPVAEKALLRTADFYWADGQFDLASDAYQAYVKSYPRSPIVPQARLREAYANLAQFHGPAFDSTSVINARAQLASLMADEPDLAKKEDLPAKLELADRQLARKLVIRADYYRRTGQPESAAKLCRRVIERYPKLPEADDARKMLAKLEPATR